jgi:hypothetical protein
MKWLTTLKQNGFKLTIRKPTLPDVRLLFQSNFKKYRFESLRKPHLNGLIWLFMATFLISKVIHSQIQNRNEWILKGIIQTSEFNSKDSAFVNSLTSAKRDSIWSGISKYSKIHPSVPVKPHHFKNAIDTIYLKYPLITSKNSCKHVFEPRIYHVNLNTCDSAELESLPKIGPVTASKIIRYRDRLGGYVSPYQLLEIYKIDSLILTYPQIQFSTEHFEKHIKHYPKSVLEMKDLYRHPYIGKSKAQWFYKYLQAHPHIKKEEFMSNKFLSHDEKLRLLPYLRLEQ